MKNTLFNACRKAFLTPLLLTGIMYAQTQLLEEPAVKAPILSQPVDIAAEDAQSRACGGFNPGNFFGIQGASNFTTQLCTPCYLAGCFTVNGSGDVISSPGCAYTVQRLAGTSSYAVSFNVPFCGAVSALVFGTSTAIRLVGSGSSGITLSIPPVSGINQTACFIVVPAT